MATEKSSFFGARPASETQGSPNLMAASTFQRPAVQPERASEGVNTTPPRRDEASAPRAPRAARIFDTALTVSLVALFFGFPLFFLGVTYQGLPFEKQLYFYFWLLLGLSAWASKAVITGEMRIRRTPLDIPLIVFWAFYVVAAIFSVDRWHSFWGFFGDPSRGVVSVTALLLFYFLLLSHFTPGRFRLMFWGVISAGAIVTLWTFLVVLRIPFLPEAWQRFAPLSLIGSLSTLTVFLSVLLPLFMTGLFLLWQNDDTKRNTRLLVTVILGVALLLDLFLLLALYQYVTWAVVLGGLAFFLIYILARIVRPSERLTWVPMGVFVAVLIFLMIGSTHLVRANLPVEVSPSIPLSLEIGKETVKHHFLTGVGPANYGYAFSLYRPAEYNQNDLYTLRFYEGKGLLFESIATIGGIGTVLLLIVWLSYLSIGIYLLSIEKTKNKISSLGLFTASVMFLIASVIAPINGPLIVLSILVGTLALAALLWESSSEGKYIHLSLKASPKFALALAFIFMVVSAGVAFLFVFMGKVLVADIQAGRAIRISATAASQDAATLLARAIQNYPQEGRYFTRLGQEYMALANAGVSRPEGERNEDQIISNIRTAVAAAETGRNRMPNDVLATESLALIYENAGLYASDALPRALDQYRRAQELEPENPLYSVKMGQIKRSQADALEPGTEKTALLEESIEELRTAIEKKANLAAAHYQLAITQARQQAYDEAIASTREAMRIDSQNVNYQYNLGVIYQLRGSQTDLAEAEKIYKGILDKNQNLIDVRLSLGLLFERLGRPGEAVAEYRRIVELLPASGDEGIAQTRSQVEQLIQNVQNGTGNVGGGAPAVTPGTEATPTTPEGPTNPNESPLGQPDGQAGAQPATGQ